MWLTAMAAGGFLVGFAELCFNLQARQSFSPDAFTGPLMPLSEPAFVSPLLPAPQPRTLPRTCAERAWGLTRSSTPRNGREDVTREEEDPLPRQEVVDPAVRGPAVDVQAVLVPAKGRSRRVERRDHVLRSPLVAELGGDPLTLRRCEHLARPPQMTEQVITPGQAGEQRVHADRSQIISITTVDHFSYSWAKA